MISFWKLTGKAYLRVVFWDRLNQVTAIESKSLREVTAIESKSLREVTAIE